MDNPRQVIIDSVKEVYSRFARRGDAPYGEVETIKNKICTDAILTAAMEFDFPPNTTATKVFKTVFLYGDHPLGELDWLLSLTDVELGVYGIRLIMNMRISPIKSDLWHSYSAKYQNVIANS